MKSYLGKKHESNCIQNIQKLQTRDEEMVQKFIAFAVIIKNLDSILNGHVCFTTICNSVLQDLITSSASTYIHTHKIFIQIK